MSPLHQTAVTYAKHYRQCESQLVEVIARIEETKLFREMGFSSLFTYVTQALSLSESRAYELITVARKSLKLPELKQAIQSGDLSVSQSKRICAVMTPATQSEWIEKAKRLKQKDLEREVKAAHPELAVPEKIRPVALNRSELRLGLSQELEKKLRRVQDLESQRQKKPASLEATLTALVELYLAKKDPLEKAKPLDLRRVQKPLPSGKRIALPASLKRQVILRDKGQCTYPGCEQRRWLEFHHRVPLAHGGSNSLANLELRCFSHHKLTHQGTPGLSADSSVSSS